MTALSGFPISARAAAIDLARARRWYEQRLGLVPKHEDPGGVWYRFAGDTWLYLYRMTLLAGLLDVGGVGARSVGALWLVCAVGFVVAGVALWRAEPWAMPLVVGLALGSLVLCVLGLPESAVGVVVNIGIVAIAGYLILTGPTVAGSREPLIAWPDRPNRNRGQPPSPLRA
jgi:hypothetical protein